MNPRHCRNWYCVPKSRLTYDTPPLVSGAVNITVQTLQRIFLCRWFFNVDKLSHDSTEKMTTYPMYDTMRAKETLNFKILL
jgi:hypothetical protein